MAKIIAVSNNKGGILKTTTTVNIGCALALEGKKVLIVDMDNQGNVSLSFGLNPDQFENTVYDVLVSGMPAEQAIINTYDLAKNKHKALKNVDLLPANDDLSFLEFDIWTNKEKYYEPFVLLMRALTFVDFKYDYILIDSPPNLGLIQGNVLTAAHEVIVPFQPENYSMRSLQKILKAISDFKEKYNQNLNVAGILPTLVDSRTTVHATIMQETRKFCTEQGYNIFESVIPRSIRFAHAIAFEGLPAVLTDEKHPIVKAYFEFMDELKEKGMVLHG